MLKFEFFKNDKKAFFCSIIFFSIFFNFVIINISQFFSNVNGSLLFDIIFSCVVFVLILYSCYLLFFSNYTKNEIAINLNF